MLRFGKHVIPCLLPIHLPITTQLHTSTLLLEFYGEGREGIGCGKGSQLALPRILGAFNDQVVELSRRPTTPTLPSSATSVVVLEKGGKKRNKEKYTA